MGIVLGFAPFICFAVLMDVSVSLALWVAFAAAFGIGMYGFLHTRTIKILDAGGLALFGLLALYTGFIAPSTPTETIRFVVDAGLLLIALVSIAMRNPFTLPYAREIVPWQMWERPEFIRSNYVITAVWVLAFAVMAAADAAAAFGKMIPLSLDIAAGLCTLSLAIVFTARYPVYLREHRRL